MSQDLYTSWSGARTAWQQLDIISSNVANSSTTGFREQRAAFELRGNQGELGATSAVLGDIGFTEQDGSVSIDNVPTHLALRGNGFFALADGTFTRDGSFRLDESGRLVSGSGAFVLGEGGPIEVPEGEQLIVSPAGEVSASESGLLDDLRIVQLENGRPLGNNSWEGQATPATGVTVMQGAVERSNVDPLKAMVELVEATRYFQTVEKAMKTSDEMTSRLNRMME